MSARGSSRSSNERAPAQQLAAEPSRLAGRQGAVAAASAASRGDPHTAILALQRMAGNQATTRALRTGLSPVGTLLSRGGRPLDAALRGEMEQRFGHDFSDVRVHTGAEATASAAGFGAKAYTVGRDLVFNEGRFAPASGNGKQLLAHELAHVVQQTAGVSRPRSTDRTEADARNASTDAAAGRTARVRTAAAPGTAQCAEDDKPSTFGRLWASAKETAKDVGKAAVSVVKAKLEQDEGVANIFKMGEEGVNKDLDKLEEKSNELDRNLIEKTKDSPAFNKAARANAVVNKFSTEVKVGAVRAVVGMVGGVAQVAANPVGTVKNMVVNTKAGPLEAALEQAAVEVKDVGKDALKGKLPTPASSLKAADRVGMAARQGVLNKVEEVKPMIAGYIEAAEKGKWGEIPGRAIVDVGSFFIGGGGAKGAQTSAAVAKGVQATKTTAQVAKGAKGLQALGETSKIAEVAKGAELGKSSTFASAAFGRGALSRVPGLNRAINTVRAGTMRVMMGVSEALPVAERVTGGASFVPSTTTALADVSATSKASTAGSSILKQVAKGPEIFGELRSELGLEAGTASAPTKAARVRQAVQAAEGHFMHGLQPGAADLAVQEHNYASIARSAKGVTGAVAESAHHAPTSWAQRGAAGYSRGRALTSLLPPAVHAAFDQFWKDWVIQARLQGHTTATVGEMYRVMEQAAMNTPGLPRRSQLALAWRIHLELFGELGLRPNQSLRLPYGNVRPQLPARVRPGARVRVEPHAPVPDAPVGSPSGMSPSSGATAAAEAPAPQIRVADDVIAAAEAKPKLRVDLRPNSPMRIDVEELAEPMVETAKEKLKKARLPWP